MIFILPFTLEVMTFPLINDSFILSFLTGEGGGCGDSDSVSDSDSDEEEVELSVVVVAVGFLFLFTGCDSSFESKLTTLFCL